MSDSPIAFTISYRGTLYPLSLLPDTTLASLQAQLEELTSVPPVLQKLLYKGKNSKALLEDVTLSQAGFKNGMKVQMLGSTTQELEGLKSEENEQNRRNRILRERAQKPATKLRSTATGSTASSTYVFHRIAPLPNLPNPAAAQALLTRLSKDPAIIHVMQKHRFSVGLLTELGPQDPSNLLGLNVNAGQEIKLRIRTNIYDGFKVYGEIRRVLCHELTHNVWSEHDNNFKELNSQLNKEVATFERDAKEGAHTLMGGGDVYDTVSTLEAESHAYVLGGIAGPSDESIEGRRKRALEAALNRARIEEEELEQSCGTTS